MQQESAGLTRPTTLRFDEIKAYEMTKAVKTGRASRPTIAAVMEMLQDIQQNINERIDRIDQRMERGEEKTERQHQQLNEHHQTSNEQLQGVNTKLARFENDIIELRNNLHDIDERLSTVQISSSSIEGRLLNVEKKIAGFEDKMDSNIDSIRQEYIRIASNSYFNSPHPQSAGAYQPRQAVQQSTGAYSVSPTGSWKRRPGV